MIKNLKVRCAMLAATALTGFGTAAADDADIFKRVDAHLEMGGEYYFQYSAAHFAKMFRDWQAHAYDAVETQFGPEALTGFTQKFDQFDQAWSLSGLNQIVAVGGSSINIGTADHPLYCVRSFVYTGEEPDGAIWDLMGQNQDIKGVIAKWPDTLIFGLYCTLDFKTALDRVKAQFPGSADWPMQITAVLDLVAGASGPVEFLLIDRGDDMIALYVSLPDAGNNLFSTLKQMQGLKIDANTIAFPMPPMLPLDGLYFRKQGERLIFMTAPDLDKAIAERVADGGALAATPGFTALAGGLPDQAASVYYASENALQRYHALLQEFQDSINPFETPETPEMPTANWDQRMLGVNIRHDDGFSSVSYMPMALTEYQVRGIMLQIKSALLQQAARPRSFGGAAADIKCVNSLKQTLLGAYMYAADHKDTLPENLEDVLADYLGPQRPTCPFGGPYAYLGAGLVLYEIENPSEYPVVVDLSGKHQSGILVGFADGHVQTVKLDQPVTSALEFVRAWSAMHDLGEVAESTLEARASEWDNQAQK